MTILPLIQSRRMVRFFREDPPSREQEEQIDTAIRFAPSKQNLFGYRVLKIGYDERAWAFKRTLFAHPKARGRTYNRQILAPLNYVFGVPHDHPAREDHARLNAGRTPEQVKALFDTDSIRDLSIAASFAILTGHSVGLATAFCGCIPSSIGSVDFDERDREAWNAVGEHKLLISFGYKDDDPSARGFVPVQTTFNGVAHKGFAHGNHVEGLSDRSSNPAIWDLSRFKSTPTSESD